MEIYKELTRAKDELIRIYCDLYKGEYKADLLRKSLNTKNDFKDYLINQIDWNVVDDFVNENYDEFRKLNII